jgi:hypothetical protein
MTHVLYTRHFIPLFIYDKIILFLLTYWYTTCSCVRTLIFGSFLLLHFVKFFFLPLFHFFLLSVLLSFLLFFIWFFYRPLFSPSFSLGFFLAHVVSSLAYPNLLGNKRLGCCCCIGTQHVVLSPHVHENREMHVA